MRQGRPEAVTQRTATRSTAVDAVIGALAGMAATAAMTVAADAMFRRLPPAERYPLPPRELTERVTASVGPRGGMGESSLQIATLVSHFGFGAVAGSFYAPLAAEWRLPPALSGTAYGLAVWTASYLGWIPALRLLRPATRHPARRNELMLGVHIVWGSVLGLVSDRLSRSLAPIAGGPLRDR